MSEPQTCWPCRRNQHDGCTANIIDFDCVCDHITRQAPVEQGALANALNLEPQEPDTSTRTRRYKSDDSLKDIQSTGRKRAAKLHPLKDEQGNKLPCDFAGKSAVETSMPNYYEVRIDGCGVRPGTMPNPAQARHHWSYVVTDNERSNIGLLCHSCHNLIHSKNDPFKDKIYERIFGFKPEMEDLSNAAKALKSGVVSKGMPTVERPSER